MTIADCRRIQLPRIRDARGSLTFVEAQRHVPFEVKRVYYAYDIPEGVQRGGHAHRVLEQALIAVAGRFDVVLDDGVGRETVTLERPDQMLYIAPLVWSELERFSPGAVCLALASDWFDEADYVRDHDAFVAAVRERR